MNRRAVRGKKMLLPNTGAAESEVNEQINGGECVSAAAQPHDRRLMPRLNMPGTQAENHGSVSRVRAAYARRHVAPGRAGGRPPFKGAR